MVRLPVSAKKKPKRLRKFRELFMKFSRSFQKSSEVFGSFRKFTKFSDAFGCVRMCSNSSWLKKKRKTETKWLDTKHVFLRCFERLCKDRAGHTPPHRSKQNKKNKVCLKWKFRSWRFILSKNRQKRSYPRGVNVRSKFLLFYVFGFFLQTPVAIEFNR